MLRRLMIVVALAALGGCRPAAEEAGDALAPAADEPPVAAPVPDDTAARDATGDGGDTEGAAADIAARGEPAATATANLRSQFAAVDVEVGDGAAASAGKTVVVHFTATLEDGRTVVTSRDGEPLAFVLGNGDVVLGLDRGVSTMKVGGVRRLTVPAAMAYGRRGTKDPESGRYTVPPEATLSFEVELLEVR